MNNIGSNISSVNQYVNPVINSHLMTDLDYKGEFNESDISLYKDGVGCVIPHKIKLETVKMIINELNKNSIFTNPMNDEMFVVDLGKTVESTPQQWGKCAEIICNLIANASFWDKDGASFPKLTVFNVIKKLGGQPIDSDQINTLSRDEVNFNYFIYARKNDINCIKDAKFDFSEVKKKLESAENLSEFKSLKNDYKNVDKFKVIYNELDGGRRGDIPTDVFTVTHGFCNKSGLETVVSKVGKKCLREIIAINLHEMTHAYLRQSDLLPDENEEGVCEYVKWWSLVNVFDYAEEKAKGFLSNVAKYRGVKSEGIISVLGFESFFGRHGNAKDLSEVMTQYKNSAYTEEKVRAEIEFYQGEIDKIKAEMKSMNTKSGWILR